MLFYSLGRIQEAHDVNVQAGLVASYTLNTTDKDYFPFMVNKALIMREMGELVAAESILTDVKTRKEKKLGKKRPEYARAINHLSAIRLEMGKLEEVEEMQAHALKIYNKEFGQNHPATAKIYYNQAVFYIHQNRYPEAVEALKLAKRIQEYTLGKYHNDYLETLSLLGSVYDLMGNRSGAYEELGKLNDAILEQVERYFPAMSEAERTKFWSNSQNFVLNYFGFHLKSTDQTWLTSMLETRWATKGILLQSAKKLKEGIMSSGDSTLINSYEEWMTARADLARYYSMPKRTVFVQGVKLDKLEERANELEKDLSQRLGSKLSSNVGMSIQDVAKQLGPKDVLVEIIRTQKNELLGGEANYLACILRSDASIQIVDMGEAGDLEGRSVKFYKSSIGYNVADNRSYGIYWQKVDEALGDVNRVYLSVDGIFNQVNVATLRKEGERFVIQDRNLVRVNSGLSLSNANEKIQLKSAFLVGNPNFGDQGTLAPLPGTEKEIQLVQNLMSKHSVQVQSLIGSQASEEKIKGMSQPSLLHIATHGFFEADEHNAIVLSAGFDGIKKKSNPLLRSGLMLVGAEDGMAKKSSGEENGILTAYEAMDLDLQGTELVILSACETGLGEVSAGEGVYGLQRAFQIAGAETIIASLWKVNDEATQELMTLFIQNLFLNKSKQEAFREAQLAILEKYEKPYYWGAFVMMN